MYRITSLLIALPLLLLVSQPEAAQGTRSDGPRTTSSTQRPAQEARQGAQRQEQRRRQEEAQGQGKREQREQGQGKKREEEAKRKEGQQGRRGGQERREGKEGGKHGGNIDRGQARALVTEMVHHRERIAKIDKLVKIFESKKDDPASAEKLERAGKLLGKENERHAAALKRFREKMGNEQVDSVLARLKVRKEQGQGDGADKDRKQRKDGDARRDGEKRKEKRSQGGGDS